MYSTQELLNEFRQIGLLDHLSTDAYQALANNFPELRDSFALLPLHVLQAVDDVTVFAGNWQQSAPAHQPEAYIPLVLHRLYSISHGQVPVAEVTARYIAENQVYIHYRLPAWDYTADLRSFLTTDHPKTIAARLIESMNRALEHKNADGRFYHLLSRDDSIAYAGPFFWADTIFLSTWQRVALQQRRLLHFDPNQPRTLSARLPDILTGLHHIGLITHMTKAARDQLERELRQHERLTYLDILYALPDILLHFDAEMIYDVQRDYGNLMVRLQSITHGIVTFEDLEVTDANLYNSDFTISFTLNQRRYAMTLQYVSDYVDQRIITELNRILVDAGFTEQFYALDTRDQTAALIFLTPEQAAHARTHLLLQFEDDYI